MMSLSRSRRRMRGSRTRMRWRRRRSRATWAVTFMSSSLGEDGRADDTVIDDPMEARSLSLDDLQTFQRLQTAGAAPPGIVEDQEEEEEVEEVEDGPDAELLARAHQLGTHSIAPRISARQEGDSDDLLP